MFRYITTLPCALALTATQATAEVPNVATDIAPVHSLVAQVMDGLGSPSLIVRPAASPHDHSLRPSEAAALAQADLLVWIGPDLTPWLDEARGSLAPGATTLSLLGDPATHALPFRDALGEADHAETETDHDDHDHGHDHEDGLDPHAWLDPDNAQAWLDLVAKRLAQINPPNAARYAENAAKAKESVKEAAKAAEDRLAPHRGTAFIVYHDAYQYFERAFGLTAADAIATGDAMAPGPASLAEVRETVQRNGAVCAFAEPQFSDRVFDTVAEGTPIRLAVIDPLGSALEPGPELYAELLKTMADNMADCFEAEG